MLPKTQTDESPKDTEHCEPEESQKDPKIVSCFEEHIDDVSIMSPESPLPTNSDRLARESSVASAVGRKSNGTYSIRRKLPLDEKHNIQSRLRKYKSHAELRKGSPLVEIRKVTNHVQIRKHKNAPRIIKFKNPPKIHKHGIPFQVEKVIDYKYDSALPTTKYTSAIPITLKKILTPFPIKRYTPPFQIWEHLSVSSNSAHPNKTSRDKRLDHVPEHNDGLFVASPEYGEHFEPLTGRTIRRGDLCTATARNVTRLKGPKTEIRRHKWVHLRSFQSPTSTTEQAGNPLDESISSWHTRYAVIEQQKQTLEIDRTGPRLVWHQLITFEMDADAIVQLWSKFHARYRIMIWQNFMLWALQHSPVRALKVLEITVSRSFPVIPRYIVEDCLDLLAGIFLEGPEPPSSFKLEKLLRLTCDFAEASRTGDGHLSSITQRIVYLILLHGKNDQVQHLYDVLVRQQMRLHPFTLLHFLKRFTKMENLPQCMQVLREISCSGIDLASDAVQSGCVSLLRTRFGGDSWHKIQSRILTQLLEMGIPPQIFMYNVAILNSVDAADYETALNIYDSARESNVKPDAITYSTLLKLVRRSGNVDIFRMIIRDAEANGSLPGDERLTCDVLWACLEIEHRHDWRSVFSNLMQVYAKYCDTSLLQDLGLIENCELLATSQLQVPSSRILGIVLIAYIWQNQFLDKLVDLYQRYRQLVEQGHPQIAPLIETDHIANAFIMAFGRRSETVEICTAVVRDMMSLAREEVSTSLSSLNLTVAAPSIITWSALLKAFSRHGQMLAAEKVLSMMRDRGLRPNQITWSFLVTGYAVSQNVASTVDVIKRMEKEGFSIDDYSLKGLGKLKDQQQLMNALDRAVREEANKLKQQGLVELSQDCDVKNDEDILQPHKQSAPHGEA